MNNTEAVYILESGVNFGPFSDENLFYIEKSDAYIDLGQGFSTVEFICVDSKGKYIFIEAKSSSPNPESKDNTNFDEFIDEITTKFQDSFQLFLSIVLGRRASSDIGEEVRKFKAASSKIKFILVIPEHKIAWLAPINEALKKHLKKIIHVWNIDVAVMNKELAKENNLIS